MRIAHIAAGAGGMYCGACARDVALVIGLSARGHDVRVLPLYTPLRMDGPNVISTERMFFGGINVFLQHLSGVFRITPEAFDRLLDSPGLLRWASQFAVRTKPEQLGPMTVSVLEGRGGRQRKEYRKLISHLAEIQPDVVSITNSLLSAIAVEVKSGSGLPVVCALQGEDSFVESMPEPYRSRAQELMRRNAESIDLFLSPGTDYARKMSDFLSVPTERIRVVHTGIYTEAFARTTPRPVEPPTIGYLSAVLPSKGLDILVDALSLLVSEHKIDVSLYIAGREADQGFVGRVRQEIERLGLTDRVKWLGEITYDEKISFLHSCTVLCQPSRIAESRGVTVLEALAAGVPVAVPDTGVFPEMVSAVCSGAMFHSGAPRSLAASLLSLLTDKSLADSMAEAGIRGVAAHYSAEQMAEETAAVFVEATQKK